ncbi:MAG TPA: CpsD/CapB family tyrosine-protein kinase [bacterium]|nr:CpsD/CapB family tyrosine-protein kinase [bacterium]
MKKDKPQKSYMVCVKEISSDADVRAIIEKLSKFCKGARMEEIEHAIKSPPFSFRRMNFDSAQAAKEELERLGCALDIREGTGVSSAEEQLLFAQTSRKHMMRLAKGVDEQQLLQGLDVFTSEDPSVEAYRALRTNLLVQMKQDGVNSFLITSPSASEGKSTIVANLGIALANAGKKTILVDMDLRHSVLHEFMGVDNSLGVTNVVLDGLDPDSAISHTVFERLHVLPSGPTPPNPAEILSSSSVRELLATLSDDFDVVLVDSPPLIGLTDAVVLGTIVGGVVLVIRAGRTSRQQMSLAVQMLENVGCRVLGAVLNEVDVHKPYYKVYAYSRPRRA